MNPIGVYIHIPFCAHKCAYCDFYSLEGRDASGYAEAVVRQIKSHKNDFRGRFVDTVYIGGGTPSFLPPDDISKILSGLRAYADVATDAEVTTYLYDDLGRLTSEAITGTNNNSTLTYTYDDRGNRHTLNTIIKKM